MKKVIVPILLFILIILNQCSRENEKMIMMVTGPVFLKDMGISLTHEHILVDFIGADMISEQRWVKDEVIKRSLPFLNQIKDEGCKTFIDCTPAFLGRDPLLLVALSRSSGLNIITNTGYYGAAENRYLPQHAFTETADQLSDRWVDEFVNGIDDSDVKPGFIKIGVAPGSLSDIHKKLVVAAARTHLKTGLTIASHTGPAIAAFEQIEILQKEGVSPEAFIWVHAQSEQDLNKHLESARMGAWISLDGLSDDNTDGYVSMIKNLKENHLLNKVLLSHDAGWYHPDEENGGTYRGYMVLFEKLLPKLKEENFSEEEIHQIVVSNPAEAFSIEVHRII